MTDSGSASSVSAAPPAGASHAVDAYTAAQTAQDAAAARSSRAFKIWRGDNGAGKFVDFLLNGAGRSILTSYGYAGASSPSNRSAL